MSGIEKYIRENIEAFDAYPAPEGSRKAFLKKVKAERSRGGLRAIVITVSSMAAAAAIAFTFFQGSLERDIERQYRKLASKETEILTLIAETSPENLESVMNTIRAVTSEAVPLEEQLPEEMEEKSRKQILKEYYGIKYKALETILEQYTETY
ncbi:MAG: hypothetical protein IJE85_05485 [Bacteroidales bacterium]|nr:hypothetical protein [Bacteroidales bacterium]